MYLLCTLTKRKIGIDSLPKSQCISMCAQDIFPNINGGSVDREHRLFMNGNDGSSQNASIYCFPEWNIIISITFIMLKKRHINRNWLKSEAIYVRQICQFRWENFRLQITRSLIWSLVLSYLVLSHLYCSCNLSSNLLFHASDSLSNLLRAPCQLFGLAKPRPI